MPVSHITKIFFNIITLNINDNDIGNTSFAYSADGSTLYDLYSEFGITAKTVSFALSNSATEVLLKVLEVKRHIEARSGAVS